MITRKNLSSLIYQKNLANLFLLIKKRYKRKIKMKALLDIKSLEILKQI